MVLVKVDEGRASRQCIATQSGLGELTEIDIGHHSLRSNLCVLGRRSPAAAGGQMGRLVRHSFSNGESLLGVSLSALFSDR
jgi:hypothetical protein